MKKTLFKYFNISLFFVLVIILLIFLNSAIFTDRIEFSNFDKESKLIISNISLKMDSIIKQSVNISLNQGVPMGSIIYFNIEALSSFLPFESERYFYELKEIEKNNFVLKVSTFIERFLYSFYFDIYMLLDEVVKEINLEDNFFFSTRNNGDFIIGNELFYDNITSYKLSYSNNLEAYKRGLLFSYNFDQYDISFFYHKEGILRSLVTNNLYRFLIFLFFSIVIILPINYIISNSVRKKFSKSIFNIIDQINSEKISTISNPEGIYDFEYYFKDLKEVINNYKIKNDKIINSYENIGILYENLLSQNLYLTTVLEKIKNYLQGDLSDEELLKLLKSLDKKTQEDVFDKRFYESLKNTLVNIVKQKNYIMKNNIGGE